MMPMAILSFNEAAAYHCGKHGEEPIRVTGSSLASMRPQHITAENDGAGDDVAALRRASMRPQHITAENEVTMVLPKMRDGCFNEAAAYHCGKPGTFHSGQRRSIYGFNEAAAYHCGKHRIDRLYPFNDPKASMRPQHITAENVFGGDDDPRSGEGFNEAAAYHCGKPNRRRYRRCPPCSFNEAAAYHCGKPGLGLNLLSNAGKLQ